MPALVFGSRTRPWENRLGTHFTSTDTGQGSHPKWPPTMGSIVSAEGIRQIRRKPPGPPTPYPEAKGVSSNDTPGRNSVALTDRKGVGLLYPPRPTPRQAALAPETAPFFRQAVQRSCGRQKRSRRADIAPGRERGLFGLGFAHFGGSNGYKSGAAGLHRHQREDRAELCRRRAGPAFAKLWALPSSQSVEFEGQPTFPAGLPVMLVSRYSGEAIDD